MKAIPLVRTCLESQLNHRFTKEIVFIQSSNDIYNILDPNTNDNFYLKSFEGDGVLIETQDPIKFDSIRIHSADEARDTEFIIKSEINGKLVDLCSFEGIKELKMQPYTAELPISILNFETNNIIITYKKRLTQICYFGLKYIEFLFKDPNDNRTHSIFGDNILRFRIKPHYFPIVVSRYNGPVDKYFNIKSQFNFSTNNEPLDQTPYFRIHFCRKQVFISGGFDLVQLYEEKLSDFEIGIFDYDMNQLRRKPKSGNLIMLSMRSPNSRNNNRLIFQKLEIRGNYYENENDTIKIIKLPGIGNLIVPKPPMEQNIEESKLIGLPNDQKQSLPRDNERSNLQALPNIPNHQDNNQKNKNILSPLKTDKLPRELNTPCTNCQQHNKQPHQNLSNIPNIDKTTNNNPRFKVLNNKSIIKNDLGELHSEEQMKNNKLKEMQGKLQMLQKKVKESKNPDQYSQMFNELQRQINEVEAKIAENEQREKNKQDQEALLYRIKELEKQEALKKEQEEHIKTMNDLERKIKELERRGENSDILRSELENCYQNEISIKEQDKNNIQVILEGILKSLYSIGENKENKEELTKRIKELEKQRDEQQNALNECQKELNELSRKKSEIIIVKEQPINVQNNYYQVNINKPPVNEEFQPIEMVDKPPSPKPMHLQYDDTSHQEPKPKQEEPVVDESKFFIHNQINANIDDTNAFFDDISDQEVQVNDFEFSKINPEVIPDAISNNTIDLMISEPSEEDEIVASNHNDSKIVSDSGIEILENNDNLSSDSVENERAEELIEENVETEVENKSEETKFEDSSDISISNEDKNDIKENSNHENGMRQEVENLIKRMLDAQKNDMEERIKIEIEKRKELEDKVSMMMSQMESMQQKFEDKLNKRMENHVSKFNQIIEEHNHFEQRLYKTDVIINQFNNVFQDYSSTNNFQHKNLFNEITKNKTEVNQIIINMENKYEQKITDIKNEYNVKIENIQNDYSVKIENMKNEHTTVINNIKKEYEQRSNNIENDYRERFSKHQLLLNDIFNRIDKLEKEVEELKETVKVHDDSYTLAFENVMNFQKTIENNANVFNIMISDFKRDVRKYIQEQIFIFENRFNSRSKTNIDEYAEIIEKQSKKIKRMEKWINNFGFDGFSSWRVWMDDRYVLKSVYDIHCNQSIKKFKILISFLKNAFPEETIKFELLDRIQRNEFEYEKNAVGIAKINEKRYFCKKFKINEKRKIEVGKIFNRSACVYHEYLESLDKFCYDKINEEFYVFSNAEQETRLIIPNNQTKKMEIIKKINNLKYTEKIEMILKIIKAMVYLHDSSIIVGNLNPANVSIDPDLEPKLIHWGINTYTTDFDNKSIDYLNFMPPEYKLDTYYDEAGDVYGAGLLINYLLTDELPKDSIDAMALDLNENIRSLVLDCIRNEPEDRISSVDLMRGLEKILETT